MDDRKGKICDICEERELDNYAGWLIILTMTTTIIMTMTMSNRKSVNQIITMTQWINAQENYIIDTRYRDITWCYDMLYYMMMIVFFVTTGNNCCHQSNPLNTFRSYVVIVSVISSPTNNQSTTKETLTEWQRLIIQSVSQSDCHRHAANITSDNSDNSNLSSTIGHTIIHNSAV